MKNTLKIILFSTLVILNIVIWYELLGINFAVAVLVIVLLILLMA
jgi:hypothetical protein